MKFRQRKRGLPAIIVIPMIDIMFFLLVFFMLGTMYMTNVQTVPVKLGHLKGAVRTDNVAFAVSIDNEDRYHIGGSMVELSVIQQYAQKELSKNPAAYVIVRTDENSSYKAFSVLIDTLKSAGIARFGLATETGEGK